MRPLALLAALLLASCGPGGTWVGSPHGYSGVLSGSQTGIFLGNPATGIGINLGAVSWNGVVFPRLDGNGEAIEVPDILTCFGTEAGTGAKIINSILVGEAARQGCP